MIGCLPTQALAFLAVFVYATHATQAIAFEWKPGFCVKYRLHQCSGYGAAVTPSRCRQTRSFLSHLPRLHTIHPPHFGSISSPASRQTHNGEVREATIHKPEVRTTTSIRVRRPSWLVATGNANGLVRFTDVGPLTPSGDNVQCALADNAALSRPPAAAAASL